MRTRFPLALAAPGALWLLAFFAVPVGGMLALSMQAGSLEDGFRYAFDAGVFARAICDHGDTVLRSVLYAAVAAALALAAGYPLAYAIAYRAGRWRPVLLAATIAPFLVSFVIRTLAVRQILGDQGLVLGPLKDAGLVADGVRVLATPAGVIAGLVYTYLPLVVLPVYTTLTRLDRSYAAAARDLGATPWVAFRTVTWPLSRPGVVAGGLLAFISCVGDYLNAELLGGTATTMVGSVISRGFLRTHDYPAAAALSLVVLVVSLVAVWWASRRVPLHEVA